MQRKINTDHVVLSTVKPEMLCMHCGAKQSICYPVLLNIMVAMMREWTKAHRHCKKKMILMRTIDQYTFIHDACKRIKSASEKGIWGGQHLDAYFESC